MDSSEPLFVLRVVDARGAQRELWLHKGKALAPFSVGRQAGWRVDAAGVAADHVMFAFNGAELFVCGNGRDRASLDGIALGRNWQPIRGAGTVALGEARIQVLVARPAVRAKRAASDETTLSAQFAGVPARNAHAATTTPGPLEAQTVTADPELLRAALRAEAPQGGDGAATMVVPPPFEDRAARGGRALPRATVQLSRPAIGPLAERTLMSSHMPALAPRHAAPPKPVPRLVPAPQPPRGPVPPVVALPSPPPVLQAGSSDEAPESKTLFGLLLPIAGRTTAMPAVTDPAGPASPPATQPRAPSPVLGVPRRGAPPSNTAAAVASPTARVGAHPERCKGAASGGLAAFRRSWRETTKVKRACAVLLVPALLVAFVSTGSSATRSGKGASHAAADVRTGTVGPLEQAPAPPTTSPTVQAPAPPPTPGPVSESAPAPAVAAATAKAPVPSRASGERTDLRTALDLVAAGAEDAAAVKLEELASAQPSDERYREAVRVLRGRRGRTER